MEGGHTPDSGPAWGPYWLCTGMPNVSGQCLYGAYCRLWLGLHQAQSGPPTGMPVMSCGCLVCIADPPSESERGVQWKLVVAQTNPSLGPGGLIKGNCNIFLENRQTDATEMLNIWWVSYGIDNGPMDFQYFLTPILEYSFIKAYRRVHRW